MSNPQVEELKSKGNAALQNNNTDEAIKYYTEAINLDKNNHILYSNRSAAYAKAGKYQEALDDSEKTISIKKEWSKGYSRKGAALELLERYEDAKATYEEGLKHEKDNQQLLESLSKVKERIEQEKHAFKNPFTNPKLLANLITNPKTRDLINDPEIKMLLADLQRNPNDLNRILNHPKGQILLSAMFNISGMQGDSGDSNDMDYEESKPEPKRQASPPPPPPQAKKEEPKKETKSNLNETQQKAEKEKELGNEAYKKKDFENALKHYDAAIETDPNNMAYYTNKAAVYFEKDDFSKCIELCEKAIEIGRENKADFAVIAKAFARIGNAYTKLKDYKQAIKYYDHSLSEHRNADILKKKQEVEKILKEQERLAYVNPEIAEQEKNLGNDAFKKGDFPLAMKHYTEAIKRNPNDPKLYRNRAACYTKLMEFQYALKDCDEAIRLDPNFVKAYLQKGSTLQALKEPSKAISAYSKAMELDPNCQEAIDGYRACSMTSSSDPEEIRKRAMQDPEVQDILKDPAMRMILEQMQSDPKAVQDHLKNPDVRAKIQKLIAAGLIQIR